ncbi:MAG: calcium-binding protein [Solirubrobacterales bacterium]
MALTAMLPAAAGAETACKYEGLAKVLQVTMSAEGDTALLKVAASGEIQVRGHGPVIACTAGPPMTSDTTDINVFDNTSNGNTSVSILEPSTFAPTTGIILAFGGGSLDELQLSGTTGNDHYVFGTEGVNTDGVGGKDIAYVGAPDRFIADGAEGEDTLSARGGSGTGAVMTAPVTFSGSSGNDTLEGGEGGDGLDGGAGNNVVRGFGGNDGLGPDEVVPGNDTFDGGPGEDSVSFSIAKNPLTVDLGHSGAQSTGDGEDTFTGIENVEGTEFGDTLTGDAGPNDLFGGPGNDTLDGRGGNDLLEGSIGTDTATYASSPGGVTVDLGAETAFGGAGADTLKNVENLVGSSFADTLTGSSAANAITPLGGADVVQAMGGPDLVNARDGVHDNVSCGTGTDKAVSDRRSLDTIQADCEEVDALPEAAGPSSGTSLEFQLTGARRQRLLKQKAVVVRARCPQEACTAVASASGRLPKLTRGVASALSKLKLKPVTTRLPAGPAETLKLRLSGKQRAAIRARLQVGEKPKLRVTVTATDVSGKAVQRSLVVLAKR